MMRREKFSIANIYVPVKRRATLKPEIVQKIAQSMLEVGQQVPIQVRPDGDRFVLVEGLHRLEACKALGEETIYGYLTQARSTNRTRFRAKWRAAAKMKRDAPVHPRSCLAPHDWPRRQQRGMNHHLLSARAGLRRAAHFCLVLGNDQQGSHWSVRARGSYRYRRRFDRLCPLKPDLWSRPII